MSVAVFVLYETRTNVAAVSCMSHDAAAATVRSRSTTTGALTPPAETGYFAMDWARSIAAGLAFLKSWALNTSI